MKRVERRPERLGAADGRPRRRLQPRTGPAARPPTCATSASTSTSRRCSTSPGPGGDDRRNRTRLRLDRGARSRRPRSPSPRRCRTGGVAATAKHFPGLGAAAENTDFAVQRIGLSKATLRAVDEAPYRRFVAAGGEMVMLSTAIYPALSPKPAAFSRADRHRRAAPPPRLRGRLDHRRARHRRGRRLRRAGQGRGRGGPRRHGPAALHRLPSRRPRPDALVRASCVREADALGVRASAQRVLRSARLAPGPRLAHGEARKQKPLFDYRPLTCGRRDLSSSAARVLVSLLLPEMIECRAR